MWKEMKSQQPKATDIALADSARELAIACELLIDASSAEDEIAGQVVVEKTKTLLRAPGLEIPISKLNGVLGNQRSRRRSER